MRTEMVLSARRFALTLAAAGIAGLGSIAVAPAASASAVEQDGPHYVVHTYRDNGPDAFRVLEHGVQPVFFCDVENAKQQHRICTAPVTSGGLRF